MLFLSDAVLQRSVRLQGTVNIPVLLLPTELWRFEQFWRNLKNDKMVGSEYRILGHHSPSKGN